MFFLRPQFVRSLVKTSAFPFLVCLERPSGILDTDDFCNFVFGTIMSYRKVAKVLLKIIIFISQKPFSEPPLVFCQSRMIIKTSTLRTSSYGGIRCCDTFLQNLSMVSSIHFLKIIGSSFNNIGMLFPSQVSYL